MPVDSGQNIQLPVASCQLPVKDKNFKEKNIKLVVKRGASIIVLACFLIISLTSCYDSKELDDWAYVYSLGIDKGVSDKIRLTVQIPTLKGQAPGQSSQGGSQGDIGQYTIVSVDCPTIFEGVNLINTSISRSLNYMHTKYILVSEDVAREGIEPFINGMRRARQIRRIAYFFVVKGSTSDFIRAFDPVIGTSIPKVQEDMMGQQDLTGVFDETTLSEMIDDVKSPSGQPTCGIAALNDYSNYLPKGSKSTVKKDHGDYYAGETPRSGGNKAEYIGTAVFDGDRMVGELEQDETRALLMVKNEFKHAFMTIEDPLKEKEDMHVTFEISPQRSPKVDVTFKDGKPIINIKLYLFGDLVQVQSEVNYESQELKKLLENSFKAYLKGVLDETIEKCQSLNCEVFNLGDRAAIHFLTIQEWEKYNWSGRFKDAQVTTDVEFVIKRTGTVMKTNPTRTSEGTK